MTSQSDRPKSLDKCPLCEGNIPKTCESTLEAWFNISCKDCGMYRVTTEAVYGNKLQQLKQEYKQSLIEKIKELNAAGEPCTIIIEDRNIVGVTTIYLKVPGFLLVSAKRNR